MVDKKILQQKMFVDLVIGNIFESQKISAFIDMLENGETTTKRVFFLKI